MIDYNYYIGKKDEIKPNTTYKCVNDVYVTEELSFWKGKIYTSDNEGYLSNKRNVDAICKFLKIDFKEI